jgi:uncharacterized membrane protein YqjE
VPQSRPTPDAARAHAARLSLFESVRALLRDLPGLVGDRVDLLSLELHRAGMALASMVAWLVVAAIVGATGWLALCAAITLVLIDRGLPGVAALIGVMVVNVLIAWWAVNKVRSLAPLLKLPATRRQLSFRSNPSDSTDASAEPAVVA